MRTTIRTALFAAVLSGLAAGADAECMTGTINTINSWDSAGTVLIEMTGGVTLQGACAAPSPGYAQLFTDSNFRQFLYPVILMAKAAQEPITICVSGCLSSTYPQIDSVEYSPRL